MKKTVSVNIKGINFLIEEDAYETLQEYLDRLKSFLKNQNGAQEIIEDIELRIAEICSSKISEQKSVIEMKDIEEILSHLGDPKDYVDTDGEDNSGHTFQESGLKTEKRLFRDMENATIGGVCAGLANYLGFDVVIVRAIFILMFFFGGFGIPLYIILWLIVPQTKSTIDRLRMKGRPITVETVREEVEIAADKLKDGSNRFAQKMRRNKDLYKQNISKGGRIISGIVGLGFIGLGLFIFILFFIFIIGQFEFVPVQDENGFLSFSDWGELVMNNTADVKLAWIAGLMIFIAAILFNILLGIRILLRIKSRWVKLSLLGLFLIAFSGGIMATYLGVKTSRDYAIERDVTKEFTAIHSNELIIEPQISSIVNSKDYSIENKGAFGFPIIYKNRIYQSGVEFIYKSSNDSLFHVKQVFTSRSDSYLKAFKKCKNVKHQLDMNGDTLSVGTSFSYPKTDKFRDQNVYLVIEVPKNGKIKFKDQIIFPGESKEVEKSEFMNEEGELMGDGTYEHWD